MYDIYVLCVHWVALVKIKRPVRWEEKLDGSETLPRPDARTVPGNASVGGTFREANFFLAVVSLSPSLSLRSFEGKMFYQRSVTSATIRLSASMNDDSDFIDSRNTSVAIDAVYYYALYCTV